ncbi:hypothetical protein Chor_014779 [Crotalus horridus]
MTMVLTVFIKYLLHSIDLQSENPWDNKAVFMLYTELFTGFIKVLLYMAFMTIMIKVHTFPLFAIRPMYLAMRQFKKAVTDAIMSRRAIRNMNTLCLRSWFQRQQTCPTCRMDVLRASLPTQSHPPPEQQEGGQHPPPHQAPLMPQPPNFPQGLLPPFPPGMFPLWPPMAPFPPVPGVQPPNNTDGASAAASSPPGAQGAGTTRPSGDSATTSDAAASAGTVPGFPFPPPPWMGMPFPPLFGFAGLTEEELRAMEGHERQHLEARLQCLQNIHTLLDAAMLQINQYLTVLATIGMPRAPPAPASASTPSTAPPETPTSPESNASEPTTSTTQPADSTSSQGAGRDERAYMRAHLSVYSTHTCQAFGQESRRNKRNGELLFL